MAVEQPLPMPSRAEVQKAPAAGPKHRACDECRVRKLACTKERGGCSRCQREGIACHYSPQKQMGRPRKRPRQENEPKPETPADEPPAKNVMAEVSTDVADPDLTLIDFLLGEEGIYDMSSSLDFMGLSSETQMPDFQPSSEPPEANEAAHGFLRPDYAGISAFGGYDQSQDFSNIDYHPAAFLHTTEPSPPAEQVPALSPNTSSYASTPDNPEKPAAVTATMTTTTISAGPALKCACSAALYLALSSLQDLEDDIEGAVRQARLTAKTAYDVVNCPICSPRIDHITLITPPTLMQSFQNMMLLGTLIPSIVHAYASILRRVDAESQAARAERRQLVFKLDGLGGTWGGIASECGDSLTAAQQYDVREMDPTLWRLTVRALLRLDVYGLSRNMLARDDGGSQEPFHLGLRDIVNLMDAKSKARHAYMDTMVANGAALPDCSQMGLQLHAHGETPTCQKIVEIARRSIDNLVIP
ncbi:RNA polymerase II-specific transcription factor-like protein [Microdochium nivale]|nr:RNA polymerase II-specific transcription factor-like protein [Microdochium nivale]